MQLLHEEQTRRLRRCFFDVQNEIGLGRQEEAYHRACELWLTDQRIPFQSRPQHVLSLRSEPVCTLIPDLVVWDLIVIEFKALPRGLYKTELVQLFDYLKLRRHELGLLVNFGLERVQVKRVVHSAACPTLSESWDYWSGEISGREREVGARIRAACQAIFEEHGTGYGDEVLSRLLLCALRQQGLSVVLNPVTPSHFRGVEVDISPIASLLVENCIVVASTALFDGNQFNVQRGKSYLGSLGLKWGIAVNFGKHDVQIAGLKSGGSHVLKQSCE